MNRKSIKYLILLLTASSFIHVGCNKSLDIDSSSVAKQSNAWKTYEDARAGVIGMYGLLRAAMASNNAHWMWGELRNGDFKATARPDLKAIIEGNLNAGYPLLQTVASWERFYSLINHCNVVITNIEKCREDIRYAREYYKLDVAQARAIRAFAYFYIARIWGDVPLIGTTGERDNFPKFPKNTQSEVLSFASRELMEVATELPLKYSGADPEYKFPQNYYNGSENFWSNAPITRLAAYAILAHIYAWQGRYTDALVYTDFVITNAARANISVVPTATLTSTQSDGLFLGRDGNTNQLFGVRFLKKFGEFTVDGHIELLTLANTTEFPMSKQFPDIYIPKDTIDNMFSYYPEDYRLDERLQGGDGGSIESYFENLEAEIPVFKKIRVIDDAVASPKYIIYSSSLIFTRLEELKLLKAEALAVLNSLDKSIEELNSIRQVRGLKPLVFDTPSKKTVLGHVFNERRKELAGEGWRWYDLVRHNRIVRDNPRFNQLIDGGGIYWPIAQDVITSNEKITQNSYWIK